MVGNKYQMVVVFALALVYQGCTSSKKFTSIRCVYDKDAQARPGASVPFGVIAQHSNSKKIITKGYLKGKYKMDNYEVTVQGGWQDGGVIFIDTLEDRNVNRTVKVLATPVKKHSLSDSFEIPLTYEGIVTWNFSGEDGINGDSKGGRVLPIRIGGTSIRSGKDGEFATSGTNALDLTVYVYKLQDSMFFARTGYDVFAVKVTGLNGGVDRFTYVAEKFGKLIIKANGGNGGIGGNGGAGPDGRDADANRVAGSGSDGGIGGFGGAGGKSGNIKVYIDTEAKEFIKYLEIQNRAGKGGIGGFGGAAGKGGRNLNGTYQSDGRKGANGRDGENGPLEVAPEIVYDYVRF